MPKKRDRAVEIRDTPMNEGTLHCRLPPELLQRFDELAEKTGVNRSQLLRAIMQKALGDPTNELALMEAITRAAGASRRIAALAMRQIPDWIRMHAQGEIERLEAEAAQQDPQVAAAMKSAFRDWRKSSTAHARATNG